MLQAVVTRLSVVTAYLEPVFAQKWLLWLLRSERTAGTGLPDFAPEDRGYAGEFELHMSNEEFFGVTLSLEALVIDLKFK